MPKAGRPKTKFKHHCHLCSFATDFPTALGRHKQSIHGIAGSSTSAVAWRAQKKHAAKKAAEPVDTFSKIGQELDAGKHPLNPQIYEPSQKFEDRLKAINTQRAKRLPFNPGAYVCPECNARYDRPQDLGRHRQRLHGVPGKTAKAALKMMKQKSKTNGSETTERMNHEEQHQPTVGDYLVGYTVGRVESLIEYSAASAEVSASDLAHRVAHVLTGKARR